MMKYKIAAAAIAVAGMGVGAGGTALYTYAATGPAFYDVFENNVTDEAAYKEALPEVMKMVKENTGVYIAGGFNKAKLTYGHPAIGNRYVIVRFDSEAALEKFDQESKAWIEKNAPHSRSVRVEGIEQK
jgi:hypothetical protein